MTCLIGYTGFVGSNIASQREFDVLVNSKNFRDIQGMSFDKVVCAGVSAVKWKANANPEEDFARITELADVLKTVSAKKFVLISTIDVYPAKGIGADESYDIHSGENDAYGRHRAWFEDFCREHFEDTLVIRLPALFGTGLKKNVVFDLVNDNMLDNINPSSSFQYYFLDHLCDDIDLVDKAGVHTANFFTEPIATSDIVSEFFKGKSIGAHRSNEVHYDLHTKHANLKSKAGPYMYTRGEVLGDLRTYLSRAMPGAH